MDSEALYAACQKHGSDQQTDAFEQLSAYFYRIAYAMLRDRPGGADIAADCMQIALVKVHQNIDTCADPAAFQGWSAQILRRVVLDTLRQMVAARLDQLPDEEYELPAAAIVPAVEEPDDLGVFLRQAIANAPLSDRSRRVVIGRFFDDRPDADLALAESAYDGQVVLPCHVQVTRAKNLAKLRNDATLVAQLRLVIGES